VSDAEWSRVQSEAEKLEGDLAAALAEAHRRSEESARALEAQQSAFAKVQRLQRVREKVRSKEWKLVEQGLAELGDERTDSLQPEKETTPSSSEVFRPPESPLGGSFFGDPSLSMLPDLLSSDTPVPFL